MKTIKKYQKLLEKLDIKDKYYKILKKDIDDKLFIINDLKNKDYSNLDKMVFKNSHGDYNVMQFIYKNNKIETIIDFAVGEFIPISWEIINSYSYIIKKIWFYYI